ncbi:MAG TPA: hypothetical protein VFG68_09840, partial [Fimbriiglobus sp.]|nr:hypothetical protein [Fimbriiglobus sp.]
YNRHTLEKWLLPGVSGGVDPFGTPTQPPPGQLSQKGFFDMLQARGPQSAIPVGGRTHGKINLNAIWHPAVLRALLDRNDANLFRDVDVSEITPATPVTNDISAWSRMTMANNGSTIVKSGQRSPAFPNVLPTDPSLPLHDTPFQGIGDVVTRGFSANTNNANYYPPVAWPLFFNQNPALTGLSAQQVAATKDHTAVLAEPLKKMFNNVTTTSDGFLVVMTIAFFEVRNDPALTGGRVYLGKELYEQVPGDRRYKFAALVDRTQLAIDPPTIPLPSPVQYSQAAATPWQTTLAEDVLPGATQIKVMASTNNPTNSSTVATNALVYVDGVEVPLLAPASPVVPPALPNFQRIRVGFGDAGYTRPLPPALPPGQPAVSPLANGGDGEELALAPLPPAMPTPIPQVVGWSNGVATITLAAPAVGYHPAGSPIGNYVLGNPGPQPTFDPNSPQYKPVVPYFARLTGQ